MTGAGLRWSGYGEFVDPQDSTLAPGQTLDLHVLLPAARCDQGEEPIEGVVRTPTTEVSQELTASGQEFLRHLWLRGCQADLVRSQVSISYADDWHLGGPAASRRHSGRCCWSARAGRSAVTAARRAAACSTT